MKGQGMPDDSPTIWVHRQDDDVKICLTWRDVVHDVDADQIRCGISTRALSLRGAEIMVAKLSSALAAVREHLEYPAVSHTECDPAVAMREFVRQLQAGGNDRHTRALYTTPEAVTWMACQQAKEQALIDATQRVTITE